MKKVQVEIEIPDDTEVYGHSLSQGEFGIVCTIDLVRKPKPCILFTPVAEPVLVSKNSSYSWGSGTDGQIKLLYPPHFDKEPSIQWYRLEEIQPVKIDQADIQNMVDKVLEIALVEPCHRERLTYHIMLKIEEYAKCLVTK